MQLIFKQSPRRPHHQLKLLEPGATCIYRVRATGDQGISAPVLVRALAPPVSRLQSFGSSPRSIILEWRDVLGESGYRIERSDNGGPFVTVGKYGTRYLWLPRHEHRAKSAIQLSCEHNKLCR